MQAETAAKALAEESEKRALRAAKKQVRPRAALILSYLAAVTCWLFLGDATAPRQQCLSIDK